MKKNSAPSFPSSRLPRCPPQRQALLTSLPPQPEQARVVFLSRVRVYAKRPVMPSLSAASAFAVLLPPLSAAFAFAVISTCVSTAKALGHVPPGVAYPPISLAGIYAPEYYLFAPGFCAIALLLFVNENNFSRAFAAAPPAAPAAAEQLAALALARSVARAGFAGLAVTGVVPLQGWG